MSILGRGVGGGSHGLSGLARLLEISPYSQVLHSCELLEDKEVIQTFTCACIRFVSECCFSIYVVILQKSMKVPNLHCIH